MLITEKYPDYEKEPRLGGHLKKTIVFAGVLFVSTLVAAMVVLSAIKDPFHLA